ncbi:MAG: hypothetical protein AAFY52_01315 [Pseudomonadota bacterium]|mgnify:CR=1 FL=1
MDLSIRDTCADCLNETGSLSVQRDLFGYIYGNIDRELSVRDHIERIRGRSINICIFLVGHEPGFNGTFTQAQALRVQHAIDLMREIYAQADLGVRRIYWRYIDDTDAAPYFAVDSGGATDLTEAYSGPNDGIDVFWVQDVTDAGGWSNSNGPCDKDAKGRTGAVLQVGNSDDFAGVLLAHEVGHYLTLRHWTTITNLMGVDSNGDGIGELNNSSRDLTQSQADDMLASCWVRPAC